MRWESLPKKTKNKKQRAILKHAQALCVNSFWMVVYFFLNIFPGVFVLYFLFSISVNQTLGYSHYQKTTFAYNATLLNQSSIIPLKLISFGCCRIYMYLNVLQNHVQTWVYFKTTCTGTGLQKQTIFLKLCLFYVKFIFE